MTAKKELVSRGKAKSLFKTSDEDHLMMVYRDDTSAFDGKKTEALKGKVINNNLMLLLCSILKEMVWKHTF